MIFNLVVQDVYVGLPWLAVTCAMVYVSFRASCRAFPSDGIAPIILHTAVLFVGLCILDLTIVGALHQLSTTPILLGAFVLCLILHWMTRRSGAIRNAGLPLGEPKGASLLWCTLAGLLAGHVIVHGLFRFPDDFDCLMYHLPFIDLWLQAESLTATDSYRWSTPANSELLGVWFVGVFSGDFLIALNNVPIMVVWAAGLLELSRRVGLRGWWRHLAAISCLAVHTTVHETDDASNDLMVVAFFVGGIAYLLRFQESRSKADLSLFSICLGLLAGVKFFAIGYASLLGAIFVVVGLLTRGFRKTAAAAVYTVTLAACFGGYWFARNYAMTGFPLYPVGAPIMDERIIHPEMWKTTLLFNGDPSIFDLAVEAVWRLCGPIHFVAVVLTLVWVVFLIRNALMPVSEVKPFRMSYFVLLICLLGSLAIILITPMLVEDQPGTLNHLRWAYTPIRYGLCYLSMVVLALFLFLQNIARIIPPKGAQLLAGLVGIVAVYQIIMRFWTPQEFQMTIAALVGLDVTAFLVFYAWLSRRLIWGMRVFVAILCLSSLAVIAVLSNQWHTGFSGHYNQFYATEIFDGLNDAPAARLVILDHRPYAFFGSRRQHAIIQPPLYHSTSQIKELMRQRDMHVVITRTDINKKLSRYRPAAADLESDPEFELVGTGRKLRMFEFNPAR